MKKTYFNPEVNTYKVDAKKAFFIITSGGSNTPGHDPTPDVNSNYNDDENNTWWKN